MNIFAKKWWPGKIWHQAISSHTALNITKNLAQNYSNSITIYQRTGVTAVLH